MRIIIALLCALLLCSCAAPEAAAPQEPEPVRSAAVSPAPSPAETPAEAPFDPSEHLIGFIPGPGRFESAMASHAFLRNAEGIGYPSKLYNSPNGIEEAISDGCEGVFLFAAPSPDELEALRAAGCKVVTMGKDAGGDACLYVDVEDYSAEIARAMALELEARGVAAGSVLVVAGDSGDSAANAFIECFKKEFPAFSVRRQTPLSSTEQIAVALTGVVGVYCADPDGSRGWAGARAAAEKELKPTPSPAPSGASKATATPKASATPEPVAEPSLAPDIGTPITPEPYQAAKNMVIISCDYTAQNLEMLEKGEIFALVARPFFDSGAQGALLLDRLLRGVQTPGNVKVNVPIVKRAAAEKYRSVLDEARQWLGEDALG